MPTDSGLSAYGGARGDDKEVPGPITGMASPNLHILGVSGGRYKSLCVWIVLCATLLLTGCTDPPPLQQVDKLVHLNDGWTDIDRSIYYYTLQDTQLHGLRYNWFLNLELPFSDETFADPGHLARFGFLVDPRQEVNEANPGNLPVGFTHHAAPADDDDGALLDITCAACHTGPLDYKGVGLRVNGGQAMHAFTTTEVSAKSDLELPTTGTVGIYHKLHPGLGVMAGATWTDWSAFDEIRVKFRNGNPDFVEPQNWKDAWRYSVGMELEYAPGLTLRTGVEYDKSPVRKKAKTPRIPDNDLIWLAFGPSYEPMKDLIFDLAYTYVYGSDHNIDIAAVTTPQFTNSALPGNTLTGRYESGADIFTAGLRWRF